MTRPLYSADDPAWNELDARNAQISLLHKDFADRDDTYWNECVVLDESVGLWHHRYLPFLRVHRADHPYDRRHTKEIVPLSIEQGTRIDVHAHPCIRALRVEQLGNANAWYYPGDRLLVLWEVDVWPRFLQREMAEWPRFRLPVLHDDTLLAVFWRAFERYLLGIFPEAQRIVTLGADPTHREDEYVAFLQRRGYSPISDRPRVYEKLLFEEQ